MACGSLPDTTAEARRSFREARVPKKKVPTRALNAVGTKRGQNSILSGIKRWLFRPANPSFEGAPSLL